MSIPFWNFEQGDILNFLYHSEVRFKANHDDMFEARKWVADFLPEIEIEIKDIRDNWHVPLNGSEFSFWEILSMGGLTYQDRDKIGIEMRIKNSPPHVYVRTSLYVMQVMTRLKRESL